MNRVLEWEEALALLLRNIRPLHPRKLPLAEAADLVLAEEIKAARPYPPYSRSLVDGYALGPPASRYRVVGEVPAGSSYPGGLAPGEAVRIFTGARVPANTSAILPQETVRVLEGAWLEVEPGSPPSPPTLYLEPEGSQITAGEKILAPGAVLGPAEIGLLSALPYKEVLVYPRPCVALAAVGSELQGLEDPENKEGLIASNLYALKAGLNLAGAQVIALPVLPDKLETLVNALGSALEEADLLLTTGGAGRGDYDLAARAFEKLGATILFRAVDFRPGGRLVAAEAGGKILLGLPGTPGAALVDFYLMVMPLVRALSGSSPYPVRGRGLLEETIDKQRRQRTFLFARAELGESSWRIKAVNVHRGPLWSGVGANALLDLPPGENPIMGGTELNFIFLKGV